MALSECKRGLVQEKIRMLLKKNPNVEFFMSFEPLKAKDIDRIYAYVPLTTVAVERSFSALNLILTEKRHSLHEKSLKMFWGLHLIKNFKEFYL